MSNVTKPKRLTLKQKKFVMAYAKGDKNATDAAIEAGYSTHNRKNAGKIASDLLTKPHIQNALQEILDKAYPDIAQKCADVMHEILSSDEVKPETRLKTIEVLAKILGWAAPKKSANLNVHIKDKLKLPEE